MIIAIKYRKNVKTESRPGNKAKVVKREPEGPKAKLSKLGGLSKILADVRFL